MMSTPMPLATAVRVGAPLRASSLRSPALAGAPVAARVRAVSAKSRSSRRFRNAVLAEAAEGGIVPKATARAMAAVTPEVAPEIAALNANKAFGVLENTASVSVPPPGTRPTVGWTRAGLTNS